MLASGIIPKAPGMEDQPWNSRGVLERVWVEEVEEGGILLRSSGEYPDYYYRESFWDLDPNKTIRFGEAINAPTFPVPASAPGRSGSSWGRVSTSTARSSSSPVSSQARG